MDINLAADAFEDDLEIVEIIEYGIPRQIRPRVDLFHMYGNLHFFQRFRLTKETVLDLLPLIEPYLEFPFDMNHSLSPMNQLLICLLVYASNSHMVIIADLAKISKSSVSRIVKRVSVALARLAPRFIKFPRNVFDVNQTKNKFYDIASFPNIVGVVDGTHVRLLSPGGDNAEVFRNRKNYFSLNVQVISNANMEIIDIVARWPGSSHDATIFFILQQLIRDGQIPVVPLANRQQFFGPQVRRDLIQNYFAAL